MPTVTVFTQVYNTAPYLPQCVESVLGQTFRDFEFIIVDNGCTDGSEDILRRYAENDSRIRLIRFEENKIEPRGLMAAIASGVGIYTTNLDSDDWWGTDYLERLLAFAQKNDLDIACTGTMMHVMDTGAQSPRKLDRPLILSREMFAEAFPWYHAFFRPIWGKIFRPELLRAVPPSAIPSLLYGIDTVWDFQLLRRAARIGIDDSVLHHYRIHKSSASYAYDPKRFDSDIYLYNDAIDFLSAFGPISLQNRNFLQCVYANALIDTTGVIQHSTLSPAEKLREYRTIASYPLTLAAYRECTDESTVRSRTGLIQKTLEAGAALGRQNDCDLRFTMQTLLPRCGRAITGANAALFLEDPVLLRVLLQDDANDVLDILLERLEKNRGVKKYALPEAIRALAADDPLLCQIDDAVFLRKYGGIYRKTWMGDRLGTLDEMAGLLLEDKVDSGKETFLTLFVSLAAAEEQVPAFFFGKLRLAELYLRQDRLAESRGIVRELEEMGLGEDEEVQVLRSKLDNSTSQIQESP